jgi:hypothetical protein
MESNMLSDDLNKFDAIKDSVKVTKYVVNIFDFDGTIYRSPTPNRDRLGRRLNGKLMSMPEQGGYGWFQNPLTLDAKYTTDLGDLFNAEVIEDLRVSLADENAKTILLTGRTEAYTGRVKAILATLDGDVVFDDYLLKPITEDGKARESTANFKKRVIDDMIQKYNADEVNMWEDRYKHVRLFDGFLESHSAVKTYNVHFISEPEFNLPDELEQDVVARLQHSMGITESAEKKVSYYGVLLDETSRVELADMFSELPEGWKFIAHHMTILHNSRKGDPEIHEYLESNMGKSVTITSTGFGISDDAIAIKIDRRDVPCANDIPHVTIAIPPGGSAYKSNLIDDWSSNRFPEISLTGTITAFY